MKTKVIIRRCISATRCLSAIVLLLALGIAVILTSTSALAAHRGIVMGQNGMAASIHQLASKVRIDILEKGGTAADAAIAMVSVLSVLEPPFSGLGGDAQTMAMTQLFTNIVDFGMNIQDAIEAKRWTHLRKGVQMTVEFDLSEQDRQALAKLGHEVVPKKTRGVYWGDCQCIQIDQETGTLFGGSESRAGGAALGY